MSLTLINDAFDFFRKECNALHLLKLKKKNHEQQLDLGS